jgi:hypothetical protein
VKSLAMRAGIVLAAAAAIAGCGGGGGGGDGGTGSAAQTPKSTALADNVPPANFDFANYERTRPLLSTEFVPDAHRSAHAVRRSCTRVTFDELFRAAMR